MRTKTYPHLTTFRPDSGGLIGRTGLVPPPQPGDSAAGNVLSAAGTWVASGGGGGSGNLDGGTPTSIYGGTSPVDGGTP